jgi:hypothetical protein
LLWPGEFANPHQHGPPAPKTDPHNADQLRSGCGPRYISAAYTDMYSCNGELSKRSCVKHGDGCPFERYRNTKLNNNANARIGCIKRKRRRHAVVTAA